jgi:hypothetical protein
MWNGQSTYFWLDWWHVEHPPKDRFPPLFAICDDLMISVAHALPNEEVTIKFRHFVMKHVETGGGFYEVARWNQPR